MPDLLSDLSAACSGEAIGNGAVVLRGFAATRAGELLEAVERIGAAAPFRRMICWAGIPCRSR